MFEYPESFRVDRAKSFRVYMDGSGLLRRSSRFGYEGRKIRPYRAQW